MTLHVSLPSELENMVHNQVKSGMYGSASEVVREALRNFFDSTGRQSRPWADIRQEVQTTLQRIDAGKEDVFDGETAFAQLAETYGLDT